MEPLLALRPRCEATVAGASHEMSGRKRLAGDLLAVDVVVVERVLDERRHALGVDDVGGQEGLHLAGDLR